ncbi:hypothetical protein MYK68_15890 [Gordonia sp. PP30]|uniref:phage tail tube protein n=1 Tax=Gordonia sp. PP30 TaxID=2935861 RepID=UPI001FFE3236|nr:hypothetical protein [Gordonia sp. PP30]UQE74192.1 hypothetical protein MYK68_15890 [Gordonia sp. PP30]
MPLLTTPDSGLLDTIPAGLYAVQVLPKGTDPATAVESDWLFVAGIKKFDPQFDPQSEDDSDILMGGWASEAGTSNGLKVSVEGLYKGASDSGDFVPDPGLTELIQAGRGIGDRDMARHFRYCRLDGIEDNYQGKFLCKVKLTGGDPKELQKFDGELICKGKPTKIAAFAVQAGSSAGPLSYTLALGTPSAGDFTLTFRGETTAPIAYNAAASAVKAALVALDDGFKASDWTVTGSAGGPYSIATPSGALTGSGSGLTGGAFALTPA